MSYPVREPEPQPNGLPAAPSADPAWILVEEGFTLAREREVESLFSIGNGHVGSRGSLAEGYALSTPATFAAGVFDSEAGAVPGLLPDPASAWIGRPRPRVGRGDYMAAIEAVLDLIRAGDIYQANFTFRADVPVAGNPLAVHARLRRTARAGYGGVIWTGVPATASTSLR